jgi:type VI protein secretion system component VasF
MTTNRIDFARDHADHWREEAARLERERVRDADWHVRTVCVALMVGFASGVAICLFLLWMSA